MNDRIVYAELSFARSGFLQGLAIVLNLGGGGVEPELVPSEEMDALAIASDWYAAGDEFRRDYGNMIAPDLTQHSSGSTDGR